MGMMQNAYTLSQAIKQYGRDFNVMRSTLNEFKEPVGGTPVGSFRGLFHTSAGFLDITLSEAGKIASRKYPQLLTLHTDKIQKEDIVTLEGRKYTVTGVDDIGGLHLCTDLSLREV